MRFLIVAAVLACASAAPSGLLAAPYGHGLVGHAGLVAHGAPLAYAHAAPVAVAHAAPLAVAAPTISPGDLQAAAIDAHVEASDHVRASHDAAREYHDQAAELHGQAINAAEDHSWQAVDAVKTREAELDGAAAGAAPILAKQIAGHAGVYAHAAAPVAYAAHAAPLAYAGHAAPLAYAGHAGHSSSVVSQSLHQSHPAPVYHAAVHAAPLVAHAAPAVAYGAHAYGAHAYGAHGVHGW
ncbi:cuticle protein LPCP-23-like [Phthorimaea operculella]|nr:cuticle protein LPCP-23-like [Phthorimaea operculella]